MIPLSKPNIDEVEISLVKEVLESGWLTFGPKGKKFEEDFARYVRAKEAVALNSCTSALYLAIIAQGLKGDILLPSFTFVASANSIITAGCRPVFVDVEYDTRNIDPSKIKEKITDKTVAIMPVHYAGQSCKMDEILEIAEKYDLAVIEDSAEAVGAEYKGRKTGSFGIGCFSFFPTKNITTGEGGMMTTNDEDLAERVKTYRGHGISSSTWSRERERKPWLRGAIFPGYNFRLSDVLAAIGVEQLKKVDEMNASRRKHAKYLNKRLDFDEIKTPVESKECRHVYQMYTITVNADRTEFIHGLREKGIGASVHFDPPVHLNPYYVEQEYGKGSYPVTEKLADTIVTLPMYPQLTKEQLDKIVFTIDEVLKNMKT